MMNVFERYKKITNIDIQKFFEDFSDFINNDYQSIVNYYLGKGDQINRSVIENLKSLKERSIEINNSFIIYRNDLSEFFDYWELIDNFETVSSKIDTVINSQKWFRSTKSLFYSAKTEKDYILKQGQTLPKLAEELGYNNPNDDWINIALENQLREEDYSLEGGSILKIKFQGGLDYRMETVIDSISGEKVYGRDLNRTTTLTVDGDGFIDLEVLDYRPTIEQSYRVLINTVKGSVPEFPNDGIQKGIIGSNKNSIQFPIIFRQLSNLFLKDDSFTQFEIISADIEGDAVILEVQARTRIGETLGENLEIK